LIVSVNITIPAYKTEDLSQLKEAFERIEGWLYFITETIHKII
jgi:hypothetical protein